MTARSVSSQSKLKQTKIAANLPRPAGLLHLGLLTRSCNPMQPANRDISSFNAGDINPEVSKSIIESAADKLGSKTGKDLVLGTVTGWVAGFAVLRVGKVAAFGLGGRSSIPATTLPTTPEQDEKPQPPTDLTMPPKTLESFKHAEESSMFPEKPSFLPPKPISHSPKISPSSIPNPSPSVSATKQIESSYPNYGGYLYSIPGYSAFQPVSYPGMMQPNQAPLQQNDTPSTEFVPFPSISKEATTEEKKVEANKTPETSPTVDLSKSQTDFEEQFTPEIIPAVSIPEATKNQVNESKMSITSLSQSSGTNGTTPLQISNKDPNKKKVSERFSLKTSIPISKIDMKCVNNSAEPILQNALTKKSPTASIQFNPVFQNQKVDNVAKVEIQSNVIIKSAAKEPETKVDTKQTAPSQNINTLINAAEAINKTDSQFRKPEPKQEVINEIKDPPPLFTTPTPNSTRSMFNPVNLETNKVNFPNKPPDGTFNEQKNQILFIQNKNQSNSKMLVAIQPQSSQMMLQRNNFDSKNLQAPSRLSSQSKKCKDQLVDNGMSSKVVALKRLHHENCDENDFENLITENQIYGNKIVVKEKSHGTLQEQDLKNKSKFNEKSAQAEPKNVVLQPNFLYLSNVQFPANLMMIKNNTRVNQTTDPNKLNIVVSSENKLTNEVSTMTNSNDVKTTIDNTKTPNVTANKEIQVLKSSNSVLTNKNNKNDLIFQTPHQKVIMNPQIVYQVPMIVNSDNKLNQPFMNREYPKFITQNKELSKQFEQPKSNDKLFIACPCQMDSKLQTKLVITNFRSTKTKTEIVSSLDIYEIRKKMRRQKYLSNRETKDCQKIDTKKVQEKTDSHRNIITPDKMKAEIYKEFTKTKIPKDEGISESDSDYGDDDMEEYNTIIKEFGASKENDNGKVEFLANLRLASRDVYKEKQLERQEKSLRRDSVALAYIAAGRIDRLTNEVCNTEYTPENLLRLQVKEEKCEVLQKENGIMLQKKQFFLSQLKLAQVSQQYKDDYEKTWQEITKERKRRNGHTEQNILKQPRIAAGNIDLDPNGQLQILTEIKKCVTDNNNLIKRRLDSCEHENEGDSIRVLAEKNFSELNKLSKMADRSVKLMTGQDTKKRDLNPGFDSENIQKANQQPFQNYPQINIPNVSKIISLKTQETITSTQMISQATSMDEPQNSAAGVTEMSEMFDVVEERVKDVACQVEETYSWPGLEALMKSYREFEAGRKKEINDLHRRNTSLRVESAHVSRAAATHSERARALLAERHNLATEETNARLSLQRLCRAVDVVRGYT